MQFQVPQFLDVEDKIVGPFTIKQFIYLAGGVGMGYSQHAGVVIVCDGTEAADRRLARVLWNDPASGVMRHADAGYEIAQACAQEQGLKLPMLGR